MPWLQHVILALIAAALVALILDFIFIGPVRKSGALSNMLNLGKHRLFIRDLVKSFPNHLNRLRMPQLWEDIVSGEILFILCSDPAFQSHGKGKTDVKQEKDEGNNQEEMPGEQVASMTEGAFESFNRIASFLAENFHYRIKIENVRYRDFNPEADLKKHMVFIGRGIGNIATAKVCEAIRNLEYNFWDSVNSKLEGDRKIKNRKGEVMPNLSRIWDKELRKDIVDRAMVLKAENPFCLGKKVLIIAGAHAHGTVAAAKFITDVKYLTFLRKEFRKQKVNWKKDFQFFVEQRIRPIGDSEVSIYEPELIKDAIWNLNDKE